MKKLVCFLSIAVIMLVSVVTAFAHPGRTDSKGGHWNHDTGEYHYHNGEYAGQNNKPNNGDSANVIDWNQPYEPTKNSSSDKGIQNNNKVNTETDSAIVVGCLLLALVILTTIGYFAILFYKFKQNQNYILSKRIYCKEGLIVGEDIPCSYYTLHPSNNSKGTVIFLKHGVITRSIEIYRLTRMKFKKGQNIILCNCKLLGVDITPLYPQSTEKDITCSFGDEPKCEFIEKYSDVPISSVIDIPETIKHINKHGDITFTNSKHTYGDYSVYVSDTGRVIHSVCGCSNAHTEINLLRLPYKYSKDLRCKRCFGSISETLLDNDWFNSYAKIILRKTEYRIDNMPTSFVDNHNLFTGHRKNFVDKQKLKQDNSLIREYIIGTDLPVSTIYFLIDSLTEPSFVRITTKDSKSYDYLISQNNLSLYLKYGERIEMFNCSIDWRKIN